MDGLHIEKMVKDKDSPWLVFLHGFGGSIKMWKRQIDFFKKKFNLCFVDLPGHGESKIGISDKKISKFIEIADIVVKGLKEVGIEKATFLCVSLGTLVFAGILKKYPEVINGAVLCGAVAGVNIFLRCGLKILNKIKVCIPYMFLMTCFSYLLLPRKGHKVSRDFFIKSGKLLGKSEFMAWFNLVVTDFNVLKNLQNVKEKILFVMGNEDYTFIKGVKLKISDFKNGVLKIINHCGHVCNIQKATDFNIIVEDYLESDLKLVA